MSRRIFEERGLRGARKHNAKAKKRYRKMLATAALLQAVRRLCYHMLKEVGRETNALARNSHRFGLGRDLQPTTALWRKARSTACG
jgi:hypothetical protein